MTDTRTEATLTWVCVCCLCMEANGDACDCTDEVHPDAKFYSSGEPPHPSGLLGAYPPDAELTIGMLLDEHDEGCPNRIAGRWDEAECTCEHVDFSRRPCAGCGSSLGGDRHAITMWTRPNEEER